MAVGQIRRQQNHSSHNIPNQPAEFASELCGYVLVLVQRAMTTRTGTVGDHIHPGGHTVNNIIAPLRLAVGSHQPGSGTGCAMNVISWEHGEDPITDMPRCTEPVLANMVQAANDSFCRHDGIEETGLLCPACSMQVLTLAHRTVDTRLIEDTRPLVIEGILQLDVDVQRWLLELRDLLPHAVRGSVLGSMYLDVDHIADDACMDRSLAVPHQIIDNFKAHFDVADVTEARSQRRKFIDVVSRTAGNRELSGSSR